MEMLVLYSARSRLEVQVLGGFCQPRASSCPASPTVLLLRSSCTLAYDVAPRIVHANSSSFLNFGCGRLGPEKYNVVVQQREVSRSAASLCSKAMDQVVGFELEVL
eukprot:6759981-Pyramimonas_sp.AAC.1